MDKKFFVDNADAFQGFTSLEAERFIDLTSDKTFKSIYNRNPLISFWVKARAEFSLVVCNALRVLVPFATSYLYDPGFSAVAVIKSKYCTAVRLTLRLQRALIKCA